MKKQKRLTEKLLVSFTHEQMASLREISDITGRTMAQIIRISLSEWTNNFTSATKIKVKKNRKLLLHAQPAQITGIQKNNLRKTRWVRAR